MDAEAISPLHLPRAEEHFRSIAADGEPAGALRISAQAWWAATPIGDRLKIFKRARHSFAVHAEKLAAAIAPELARTPADTVVAEVLPLLEACRFLERQASRILATRRLGRAGRPV